MGLVEGAEAVDEVFFPGGKEALDVRGMEAEGGEVGFDEGDGGAEVGADGLKEGLGEGVVGVEGVESGDAEAGPEVEVSEFVEAPVELGGLIGGGVGEGEGVEAEGDEVAEVAEEGVAVEGCG